MLKGARQRFFTALGLVGLVGLVSGAGEPLSGFAADSPAAATQGTEKTPGAPTPAPALARQPPGQAGGPPEQPKEGVVYRETFSGLRFIWVPGGSFEMGCGGWNGPNCNDEEKPLRTVGVKGFWLGIHEVTQGQWKLVMGKNPSAFPRGETYPVERVSWLEAQLFLRKLSTRTSITFRLPTEAEWEFACRGGGQPARYAWGNGEPVLNGRPAANIADQTFGEIYPGWRSWEGYNDGHAETAPVGTFAPNALGLFDMTGNVWEWVEDAKNRYDGVPTPAGQGGSKEAFRVLRGGGWSSEQRYLSCSNRPAVAPTSRDYDLGFRVARSG